MEILSMVFWIALYGINVEIRILLLAEQMIQKGCRFRPSDRSKGSRVSGKNEIHRRLQIDEFTEQPRMVFFNTCTETISQLPAIPLDKKILKMWIQKQKTTCMMH